MTSAGLTVEPCAFPVPETQRRTARTGSVTPLKRVFIAAKSLSVTSFLKCGRRVDPQDPGFRAPRISPPMRNRAFKIQTVAAFKPVMLAWIQPDFKISAKHMQEFLPLVRVGFAAAPAGLHAKKVRLHRRVAPRQQFHANVRC